MLFWEKSDIVCYIRTYMYMYIQLWKQLKCIYNIYMQCCQVMNDQNPENIVVANHYSMPATQYTIKLTLRRSKFV